MIKTFFIPSSSKERVLFPLSLGIRSKVLKSSVFCNYDALKCHILLHFFLLFLHLYSCFDSVCDSHEGMKFFSFSPVSSSIPSFHLLFAVSLSHSSFSSSRVGIKLLFARFMILILFIFWINFFPPQKLQVEEVVGIWLPLPFLLPLSSLYVTLCVWDTRMRDDENLEDGEGGRRITEKLVSLRHPNDRAMRAGWGRRLKHSCLSWW